MLIFHVVGGGGVAMRCQVQNVYLKANQTGTHLLVGCENSWKNGITTLSGMKPQNAKIWLTVCYLVCTFLCECKHKNNNLEFCSRGSVRALSQAHTHACLWTVQINCGWNRNNVYYIASCWLIYRNPVSSTFYRNQIISFFLPSTWVHSQHLPPERWRMIVNERVNFGATHNSPTIFHCFQSVAANQIRNSISIGYFTSENDRNSCFRLSNKTTTTTDCVHPVNTHTHTQFTPVMN